MLTFENGNATDTEKAMFGYAGLYRVEHDEAHSRYAVIHTDVKGAFPSSISVSEEQVDYGTSVTFWYNCENIEIAGWFDFVQFSYFYDRMKELGWK